MSPVSRSLAPVTHAIQATRVRCSHPVASALYGGFLMTSRTRSAPGGRPTCRASQRRHALRCRGADRWGIHTERCSAEPWPGSVLYRSGADAGAVAIRVFGEGGVVGT
jgi:hypothetical protein